MFRRHPILTVLTIILLGAGAWLGLFLYNFDLDRHRVELEQRLSTALQRPVHLGSARFALHGGIALEFSEVVVGDREEEGILRAARLALRLELLPLLRGHLTFNRLLLDTPEYTLARTRVEEKEKAGFETLLQRLDTMLQTTLVRDLTLHHGLIRLVDQRRPGPDAGWEIRDIAVSLTNLGGGGVATLRSSATWHRAGTSTPMAANGALDFPTTLSDWRRGRIDLRLALDRVNPGDLGAVLGWPLAGVTFSGRGDLGGRLTGTPQDGLDIALTLTGRDLALALPAFYGQPLPLRNVAVSGRWNAGSEHRLSGLAAEWDGLRLGGELRWPATLGTGELIADLTLPETPIPRLLPLLPDHGAPEPLLLLRRLLRDGSADIARLRLHWPLTAPGGEMASASGVLREAEFALRHGLLELPGLGAVHEVGFAGSWRNETLTLAAGEAGLLGGKVRFQGGLAAQENTPAHLDLRVDGTLSAAALFARLPGHPPSGTVASGDIPVHATVGGSLDHLVAGLKADLHNLELTRDATTLKRRGTPGELFVTADLGAQELAIGHFYLQSPLLDLRGSGRLGLQAGRPFLFIIDLTKLDFAEVKTDIAAFNLLRPRGAISGRWVIAGDDDAVDSNHGEVVFRDLSLHLGGAVADVSAASGKLAIVDGRIAIEHVSGLVGTSLLSGRGNLGSFDNIRLDLTVSGEKIRARDLVFRSESAVIRSVAGRVVIDTNGIDFDGVRANLDGGTSAVVQGRLRDFNAPQVDLDIVAERANVEEVVQLWQQANAATPAVPAKGAAPPHGGGVRLAIRIAADKGNIYGLPFTAGRALLTLEHGQLLVLPLRLRTGVGSCTGQVLVRDLSAEHPLLTLSGKIENADAAAVHNQLLRRKGLIEGSLDGDFYLQGELGRFLSTSSGDFSVQLENGVLRQFPVLAKVFSILNVSQIFALRLPDMANEGMPFDRLRGTLALRQGLLQTEDLVVESNAMNLAAVGGGDLVNNRLDLTLGIKPLRTVDKIVSSIPLAGWVFTGKEKALITAQFRITGRAEEPEIKAIPFTSLSDMTVGFFRRAFGLPGKMIEDLGDLVGGEKK
ncbi:MAG: hypothetical protein A2091_06080 [Desulfuromonadales bacterium GWD2_61_12]|nr:MAG: hypothetical protein A2005_07370 [Desulfuromonadales bacterium GWC2_61_20]OGR36412.1 MAG: hypothetical protein A2091_06080 [Desulfuromonadales bacterium GWD2_61_12]HAD03109.1 hypothetical protein [Desulfuromonas sp.]HBT83809.1 hypothetical protein [Desulfuromonas sp.]